MAQQGFFVVHDTPSLAMRGGHARIVKVVWGSGYHSPIAESRSHYTPLFRAEKPDGEPDSIKPTSLQIRTASR